MAYENETKNLIAKLSGVWVESEKKEILKELQEVYRKAEAFDEVIKNVKTEFVSQDLADATRTLVYDYEYEKEDE